MQPSYAQQTSNLPQGQASCHVRGPVITIDGPAGTGKSSIGVRLARHFGWCYIDSGAMYRALALLAAEQGILWTDESALARLCTQMTFKFFLHEGQPTVQVNGRNVTLDIRRQGISEGASRVATLRRIREILVEKQRRLACAGGLVMDGRDIGTVVFPNAEGKFYLDATPEARGQRRWLELQGRGEETSLSGAIEALRQRDRDDRTREISPLRVPDGAYYIDTTNLSVDDVFELMVDKIKLFGVSFRSRDTRQGTGCLKST